LHLKLNAHIIEKSNTKNNKMKYNPREKALVKNVRKLLDMMTHPTLITFLTSKEYKMVQKIKQDLKQI